MTTAPRHAIYGLLPAPLLTPDPSAVQTSPLIPQSVRLEDLADGSLESLVVYAPQGTIERRYILAVGLQKLAVGGKLTALAPKDKGGTRLKGDLSAYGCTVVDTPQSHHRVCTTTRPTDLTGLEAACALGAPHLDDDLGLWTQAGIFSYDRLDTGSGLLMQHLPALAGKGADLGCGLGVLSAHALAQSPDITTLTLIDCDRRAVEAAVHNVADARAQFVWADVRTLKAPPQPLDFVLMNPPFHEGGREEKTLGQAFIAQAAAFLKAGGVCWLTANRHLPYEATLAAHFSKVTPVADEGGFKIICAEK